MRCCLHLLLLLPAALPPFPRPSPAPPRAWSDPRIHGNGGRVITGEGCGDGVGGGAAAPLSPLQSPACAHPTTATKLLRFRPPFSSPSWILPPSSTSVCGLYHSTERGVSATPLLPPLTPLSPLSCSTWLSREGEAVRGGKQRAARTARSLLLPVTPPVKYRRSSRGREESRVGEAARWRIPLFAEWYNPQALAGVRGRIQLGKEKGGRRNLTVTGGWFAHPASTPP